LKHDEDWNAIWLPARLSAAIRRGLIEARPRNSSGSVARKLSAAIRRGLIEAGTPTPSPAVPNRLSAAIRRGLIEARFSTTGPPLPLCYPRRFAAALLKLRAPDNLAGASDVIRGDSPRPY